MAAGTSTASASSLVSDMFRLLERGPPETVQEIKQIVQECFDEGEKETRPMESVHVVQIC